jgi:translation initiation factor IF-2
MSKGKTTHKETKDKPSKQSESPATAASVPPSSRRGKEQAAAKKAGQAPEKGAAKTEAGAPKQPKATADAAGRTRGKRKATSSRPKSTTAGRASKKAPAQAKPPKGKPVSKSEADRVQQPAKPGAALADVPSEPQAADVPATVEEVESVPASDVIMLPSVITLRDLSKLLDISPINLIRELMNSGVMANINQEIDYDTAAIVAADLGFEVKEELPPEPVEEEPEVPQRKRREYTAEEVAKLVARPPVVTIMGHVDHGKTSLLDVIREANVVDSEAGGITQHIGAYQIETQGKKITFLDTPGHEAFTAMRARGAMATDIAILVVAADDGVQPQTIEAINHARAAQVPIIVALNKIDKANANPDAVKQQLADVDLLVEEYGGDVICVPVSAKQKTGLESLLEMILLVAEMADLKANPEARAEGTVIEGRLDQKRGSLGTLLVQEGTLRVGSYLVIGDQVGKARAMFDDQGKPISSAPPSTPAVILGLNDVPTAGDTFIAIEDEHKARDVAAAEVDRRQEAALQQRQKALSLDEFFAQAQAGQVQELNIILKADVQGSIEPIVNSVERLGDETIKARFLHAGTGNINESDIMLAVASNAIVIGFNTQVDTAASRMAENEGVDIRPYDIIYKLIDDIDLALKGMLEPTYEDVTIGRAEVRAIFRIPNKKQIAGCMVTDGVAARNALIRVRRDDQVLYEGQVASLRRFKDDVREVSTGMECGVGVEGFRDFAVGDTLEFYRKEQVV